MKTHTLHLSRGACCAYEVGMTIHVGDLVVMEIVAIDRQEGVLYITEQSSLSWARRLWLRFCDWWRRNA